jgi:hypothetical protein
MLTRHNKNKIITSTIWNLIMSTEMFKFIVSMNKISSISNLKKTLLFLFKMILLIRCKVVNCSMFFKNKFVTSWSINIFLNSRSSYLDAIKTLYVYDIETTKTVILFIELNLCLNVLLTIMLMIVIIVFKSFNESTKMKNDFNSLSNLMINSLIETLSNKTSMSMFNFSKNWIMKSFSWLSFHSMINCFKRHWNLWRDFHLRLRFAKHFFELSIFFSVWFVNQ